MKKALLASAVVAAAAGLAWAVDYDLSSLGASTNGGRYISSLNVSDDAGSEPATIGTARTTGTGAIYWDFSDQVFTTEAGATVSIKVNGAGEWMHTYIYHLC